jgi:hypothetical protein
MVVLQKFKKGEGGIAFDPTASAKRPRHKGDLRHEAKDGMFPHVSALPAHPVNIYMKGLTEQAREIA